MPVLTALGKAKPGDHVRIGVKRIGGKYRFSRVDHICVVDHTYGPHGKILWVKPICGGAPGRAETSDLGLLCKKCEQKEAAS